MASWLIHLIIADGLLNRLDIKDPESFVVGNISPDCGVPVPGGNYDPPTCVTHFSSENRKADIRYADFYDTYLMQGGNDFYLGYFSHLVTDYFWSHRVAIPIKRKFGIESLSKDPVLTKKIKDNWAELEMRYLADRGRPKSLDILKAVEKFPNVYFDFYGVNTIENKAKHIASLYDNVHHITDDLSYMSSEELESFVSFCVDSIFNILNDLRK